MPDSKHTFGDRFHITKTIGCGATALVLLAQDNFLDRQVAIKMPKENLLLKNPEFRTLFIKEAKYQAMFDHPNILPLYDCYDSPEGPILVLRYAENTVRNWINDKEINIEFMIEIIHQIADALDYCCERGFAHRDVKPENILCDSSRHSYLTDFGLAAPFDDSEKWKTVMGTPPFVCPEIIFEQKISPGSVLRARADQFSLGVMLFEMITGHLPFESPSNHKYPPGWENCTALRLWKGETRPHCYDVNPRIPVTVDSIIERMLSIDPEERYISNSEAINNLQETLQKKYFSEVKVFISFSHEDIGIVENIVQQLESRGLSVWWDSEISHLGDWDDQIEKAMLSCHVMAIFLSPNSVNSDESKREWKYWIDQIKKPIIPVIIQDCRLPYRLSSLQHISAIGKSVDEIASNIVQAIRRTINQIKNEQAEESSQVQQAVKYFSQPLPKINNIDHFPLQPVNLKTQSGLSKLTQVPEKYVMKISQIEPFLKTL
jgi:serine/threonine protein kinase